MTRRRIVGFALIAGSVVGLVVAFLGLRTGSAQGLGGTGLGMSPWMIVFWSAAAAVLVVAVLLSTEPRDRVGLVLGSAGLCLVAAYAGVDHLAGRFLSAPSGDAWALAYGASYYVLVPVVAFAFSVVATILGWHLVMPSRTGSGR